MVIAGLSAGCRNVVTGGDGNGDAQAPAAPSALVWREGDLTSAATVTATWRPSASPDVAQQTVRFYTGAGCSTARGEPVAVPGYAISAELVADDGASYSFDVTARDLAGNETRSSCSPVVAVDRTGPGAATALAWGATSPHATLPTPASWTRSPATDLAAQRLILFGARAASTCDVAPVATLDVTAGASSLTVDIPGDGAYRFRIESVDAAGNRSLSGCSPEIVVATGGVAAATGLSWVEAPATNQLDVTARWTLSPTLDVDGQRVQFYADGTCTTASGAPVDVTAGATTAAFAAPGDGVYSYTVASYRTAGATTTSACSQALGIDTIAPAPATMIGWTSQTDTSAVGEWVPSTSPDVAAQYFELQWNACSAPVGDPVRLDAGAALYDFVPTDDGDYWFDIITVDSAGNQVTSACSPLWASFDLPPAPATNLGFEQDSVWEGAYFTAVWTPSPSPDAWLEEVYLYSDESCTTPLTDPVDPTTAGRLAMPVLASGVITYQVHTYDWNNETVSRCSKPLYVSPHPTAEAYVFSGTFPYSVSSARVDPGRPSTIYALLANGRVFRSADAGVSWTVQCRIPYYWDWGRGRVIVSPAADGTAYVAAQYLYRVDAVDGADCPNLKSIVYSGTYSSSVAVDPAGLLYAWTYSGLLRSSDQGWTWTTVNSLALWDVSLSIDPASGALFAVEYDYQNEYSPIPGIQRSTDGGVTWTRVDPGWNVSGLDLFFDAAAPGWIFTRSGYYSSSGGATWSGSDWNYYLDGLDALGAGYRVYTSGNDRLLYWAPDMTSPAWSQRYRIVGVGSASYDSPMVSTGGNTIVVLTNGRLYVSTNRGASFTLRTPSLHDGPLSAPTIAAANDTVWVFYENALWLSSDGASWAGHFVPGTGYNDSVPQRLELNPADPQYAFIYGQDPSSTSYGYYTRATQSGPDGFSVSYGYYAYGYGRFFAMDAVDPDRVYGFAYYDSAVSTDGGWSFSELALSGQPFNNWQFQPWHKAVVSPASADRVLYGSAAGVMYEYDNTTQTSTDVTSRLPFADPAGLEVYDAGWGNWVVRVISQTGSIAESSDGGRTFTQTAGGYLATTEPRRILATYDQWSDFVATAGLEKSGQAAYSFNGGATWIPVEIGDCRVRDIALTGWGIFFACRDASVVAVTMD